MVCQWRAEKGGGNFRYLLNPLNSELNPICHLLALLGAHPILHVSRIRVNLGKWHSIYVALCTRKYVSLSVIKKKYVQCVNETIVITTKTYFVNVNGTAAHMRTH